MRQASLLCGRLPVLRLFLSEEPQQHLVSNLIASQIIFAESDQPTIPRDIFVVDEALHNDLPRVVRAKAARLPKLPLGPDYVGYHTQCKVYMGQSCCLTETDRKVRVGG